MELSYNFTLLMFITARMSGCVLFNPILGRKNIPAVVKIGLTLSLSLFAYGMVPVQTLEVPSFLILCVLLARELLVGFLVGYVMQMFTTIFLTAGETMDMQVGLAMSRFYDPQSNLSMPMTGSMLNAMYVLVFFASGAHLTLLRVFVKLCTVVPYASFTLRPELFGEMAGMLSTALVYAVQLALPLLAAELITEVAVGLIMKAVPQIDVFVINIQMKVAVGFAVILLMVPSYSRFLQALTTRMFDYLSGLFQALL